MLDCVKSCSFAYFTVVRIYKIILMALLQLLYLMLVKAKKSPSPEEHHFLEKPLNILPEPEFPLASTGPPAIQSLASPLAA
jgi:hypothetical protein